MRNRTPEDCTRFGAASPSTAVPANAAPNIPNKIARTGALVLALLLVLAAHPFAGNPAHTGNVCKDTPACLTTDAKVTCCVNATDDGGDLIDVCSYPSATPNSDPSDCIISPPSCSSNSDCDDHNPCTVDQCVS